MPRPQNKKDLLIAANEQFAKLLEMIDNMTAEEQAAAFSFPVTEKDKEAHWLRDKNLRDVLVHLYEWHQLLLNWVQANYKGSCKVPFLPAPYNWKNYAEMNIGFWEKHQTTQLDDAKAMLLQSHKDVLAFIEQHTNEALFQKGFFSWCGTTSIGSYYVSATSSHYAWAIKKLKRQIKARR